MSNLVTIHKTQRFSSSHSLDLPYESKCNQLHGHNYRVQMWVTGQTDETGMVVDFHHLKKIIKDLDHINLNEFFDIPTTAENIAVYLAEEIKQIDEDRIKSVRIRVWETDTAYAEYEI